MTDDEPVDRITETLAVIHPGERARLEFEVKISSEYDTPEAFVHGAMAEYGHDDPYEALIAAFSRIDMDEQFETALQIRIDPVLFKRAWFRYELAKENGRQGKQTFDDIMFDYVQVNPEWVIDGPLFDASELAIGTEEWA